jgi:hypothetical protein
MCAKRIVKKNSIEIIPQKVLSNGVEEIKDSNDDVQRQEIRERVGLTYEQLCKTVRDGLVAEVAILDDKGKVVNRVPANSERAKFVAAAVDILGAKKSESSAQKCPAIIIILPNGQRQKI